MKNKLTIVVPTYRRHHLVDRTLPHLVELGVPIMLLDSTEQPYPNIANLQAVDYIHCPELTVTQKLSKFIQERVDTPYILMCADDMLPSGSAVYDCLNFLEDNPDYVVAQGITIDRIDRNLCPHKQLSSQILVDAERPSVRIMQHFSCYFHTFYGVQRTASVSAIYKAVPDGLNNFLLFEYYALMITLIHGKVARFATFFNLNDYVPSVCSGDESPIYNRTQRVFKDHQFKSQIELLKSTIASILNEREEIDLSVARKYIDAALISHLAERGGISSTVWHDCTSPLAQKQKTIISRMRNEFNSILNKTIFAKRAQRLKLEKKTIKTKEQALRIRQNKELVAQIVAKSNINVQKDFQKILDILGDD